METLELGPVPSMEDCEQVGPNYRPERARLECETHIAQLKRMFPDIPEGVRYIITRNPHSFGTYLEVAIRFDFDNEAQRDYAYMVESDGPENWDTESRKVLGLPEPAQAVLILRDPVTVIGPFPTVDAARDCGIKHYRLIPWIAAPIDTPTLP